MRKKGKHFARKGRTATESLANTQEYCLATAPLVSVKGKNEGKAHHNVSYFLFTMFVCLLLAASVAAVLCVDYFGRAVSEGTEFTFAFNVSQDGEAVLSLLGREYSTNVAALTVAAKRVKNIFASVMALVPKSIVMLFAVLPELYERTIHLIAESVRFFIQL